MTAIAETSWIVTCKICTVIRNSFLAFIAFVVASGEIAGRSRAASELARLGYNEEAKALMLEIKQIRETKGL